MNVNENTEKINLHNLEEQLDQLEHILKELERGDLGLAESIQRFEKGVTLYEDCKNILREAEVKIQTLSEKINPETEVILKK